MSVRADLMSLIRGSRAKPAPVQKATGRATSDTGMFTKTPLCVFPRRHLCNGFGADLSRRLHRGECAGMRGRVVAERQIVHPQREHPPRDAETVGDPRAGDRHRSGGKMRLPR
jgi:hypothetical protein